MAGKEMIPEKIKKYIETRKHVRDWYHNTDLSVSQVAQIHKVSHTQASKMIDGKNEPKYYTEHMKGGEKMKILINLKAIEIETTDIENLMIIKRQLMVIDEEYVSMSLTTPDWVLDKLGEVGREIKVRVEAELTRKLRNAESRRDALKSMSEKREDIDKSIASLKAQLGQ
jgi:hypothetical protein